MNKKQLVEVIGSGTKTFLYFHAPFCNSCKKISWLVERERTPMYKIDGEVNKDLMEAFKIEVYPTIIEIRGTSKRTYKGSDACINLLK